MDRALRRLGMAMLLLSAIVAPTLMADVIYVSSHDNDEVLRYDEVTGVFMDTFIPSGAAGLNEPHGTLDRGTDLLVCSFATDQILRFDRDTGDVIGVFADSLSGLDSPVFLAIGMDANVYVSSQGSDEILRFAPDGTFIDAFVSAGSGGLDGPSGFAFGDDGRLYVASRYTGQVLAYDAATGAFIEAVAGPADGLGVGNTFGIDAGDNGDLYVASNGSVMRFDLDTSSVVATFPLGFPIGVLSGRTGGIFAAASNNLTLIDTNDDSTSSMQLSGGTIALLNFFSFSGAACDACPGDFNLDRRIDGGDIPLFVDRIVNGAGLPCADLNGDANEDALDVTAFVGRLLNGGC